MTADDDKKTIHLPQAGRGKEWFKESHLNFIRGIVFVAVFCAVVGYLLLRAWEWLYGEYMAYVAQWNGPNVLQVNVNLSSEATILGLSIVVAAKILSGKKKD